MQHFDLERNAGPAIPLMPALHLPRAEHTCAWVNCRQGTGSPFQAAERVPCTCKAASQSTLITCNSIATEKSLSGRAHAGGQHCRPAIIDVATVNAQILLCACFRLGAKQGLRRGCYSASAGLRPYACERTASPASLHAQEVQIYACSAMSELDGLTDLRKPLRACLARLPTWGEPGRTG